MLIGVLGVSHRSSSLALRENIAKIAHRHCKGEEKIVPLLTCNRTEIYFSAENLAEAQQKWAQLLQHPCEPSLYTFFGRECFVHLASVTAGLDSAVMGESDIQRQVKLAYQGAAEKQKLPSDLHFLFQKCLKMGKWARSSFSMYSELPTIEGSLFRLMRDIGFFPSSILFIGHSEINRKIISYFKRKRVEKMTLCTRNFFAAESFALDHGISLCDWREMGRWYEYDLVVCGTVHDQFLIKNLPANLKTRLIFDLSVPRVVDPEVGKHPGLLLWNIDDIASMVEKTNQRAIEAKKEVERQAGRYLELYQAKNRKIFACV